MQVDVASHGHEILPIRSPIIESAGEPKKGPIGTQRRTVGPPWLVSPARHEPVRISSPPIIQVAESRFNRVAVYDFRSPSAPWFGTT